MEKFRTRSDIVRIDVNDDGYIVELPVANDIWMRGFYSFCEAMEKRSNKYAEKNKGVEDVGTIIADTIQFDEECKNDFCQFFGAGSYGAVFGAELVGIEYVVEFLEYCLQFVEKRTKDREKAFSKYDPNKRGGAG